MAGRYFGLTRVRHVQEDPECSCGGGSPRGVVSRGAAEDGLDRGASLFGASLRNLHRTRWDVAFYLLCTYAEAEQLGLVTV